jgi:membrane protein implicated in regulation of membrane protease activity
MLRRGWLIILICALIVSPVLFGLEVLPGAAAWLLFLGFALLIVATLVFGEQTRRRSSKLPAGLL